MHRYTRAWSGQQAVDGVSIEAVRSVLDAGGGRWLDAFLAAAEAAGCSASAGPAGRSLVWSGLADDETRQFVWSPNRDPRLFRRFYGYLDVEPAPGGSLLTLSGTWFDGRASINEAALETLLARLGAALGEVFEHRPRRRGINVGPLGSGASVGA